jgi:multicomponent Na+:H+ antiporter subunit B
MTPGQRRLLFLVAAAGLVACYLWAFTGLPGFGNYPGPYGPAILHRAIAQTHATGVVSAVNFEYRGIDTVGEEFILFTAAAGMAVVLRRPGGERERPPVDEAADRRLPPTSSAVRTAALLFVGPTALLGWWLTSHAQTNPSGGFAAVGVTAVVMGLPYLYNFLPLGQIPGAVSSSGTIALISFFVGLEVAAAFTLIVGELLEQTLLVRSG